MPESSAEQGIGCNRASVRKVPSDFGINRFSKRKEPRAGFNFPSTTKNSRVTTLVINLSIIGQEPSVFGKNRSSLRKEPSVFGIERRSGAPWRQTRIGFNKMNRGHNVFLYWTMLSNYNLFDYKM